MFERGSSEDGFGVCLFIYLFFSEKSVVDCELKLVSSIGLEKL